MEDSRMAAIPVDQPRQRCGEEGSVPWDDLPGSVRAHPRGFVHVLWLLVVLSAFVFGATLVNIAVGIKICETLRKQSAAVESLTSSVREVQKSVLSLSQVIEETFQGEEEFDHEAPSKEGRI